MRYLPLTSLVIILILPAITLLGLRKEKGLQQTDTYTVTFFHRKKDFQFSFVSPKDNLNSIALKMWNLSLEKNKPIYFKLSLDQQTVRQLVVNDSNIINGDMVRFSFPEVVDSKGKYFTLTLNAPETQRDDVLGVYINSNNYPVINTFHKSTNQLQLILGVYWNLIKRIIIDKTFLFFYTGLFTTSIIAITIIFRKT